ncbi:hypothetical protein EVAR_6699_1 [Eumeta japonica]|uniref:Uncharacterized protein n=1 Tax=Eumeta variegata TaxID=151549 RepID=A0A4C1TKF4_EUMVA|nr:hypothetical protein EVAR_6699_1 [Eumeta japonica]
MIYVRRLLKGGDGAGARQTRLVRVIGLIWLVTCSPICVQLKRLQGVIGSRCSIQTTYYGASLCRARALTFPVARHSAIGSYDIESSG